jgi:pimeloyl-ACP methyl ester carboxylesterase
VIGGGEDRFFPPEIQREAAGSIPGAELHVIPRAKHGAFLTHKPTFEREITAFLDRAGREG